MEQPTKSLEEAKLWIERAISYRQESTLPSLLAYFQEGYTSGNWHLPSIITRYDHSASIKLAVLINELIQTTGFYLDEEKVKNSANFLLYFDGYVGNFNPHTRTFYSSTDFYLDPIKQRNRFNQLLYEIQVTEKQRDQAKAQLESIKHRLFSFLYRKRSHWLEGFIDRSNSILSNYKIDVAEMEHAIEMSRKKYEKIKIQLSLFEKLVVPFGMKVVGTLNVKECRLSFYYHLRDKELKNKKTFSTNTVGVYTWRDFVVFNNNLLDDEDIMEVISDNVPCRPMETSQENFHRLNANKASLSLSHFSIKHNDEDPTSDIESVSYTENGFQISFDRAGKLSIKGSAVWVEDVFSLPSLEYLLGVYQKNINQ